MPDELPVEHDRLSVTVTAEEPLTVVTVAGDVDLAVTAHLRAGFDRALEGGPRALVADFSAVPFCDSSGLTALVETHKRAEAAGAAFVVVTRQRALLRPLSLLGLDSVLTVRPTLEEARALISDGSR